MWWRGAPRRWRAGQGAGPA
uniref:ATP sulfurylase n=1 Tax=Arundo donax TaxID=35708 RepID=A0A0A9HNE3_ARUDO